MKRILSILMITLMILAMIPAIAAESPETLTITLYDSYDDGWNGAQLFLWNGSTINELTLEDGEEKTLTIPYDPHLPYGFIWIQGPYDDEIRFVIEGAKYFGEELNHLVYYPVLEPSADHEVADGACIGCEKACGTDFGHYYVEGVCTYCEKACEHSINIYGFCNYCLYECAHDVYESGFCTLCGDLDPNATEFVAGSTSELVAALNAGVDVTLKNDIELDNRLGAYITLQDDMTLDLNGNTLSIAKETVLQIYDDYVGIEFILKNGTVIVDKEAIFCAVSSSTVWIENATLTHFDAGDNTTVYLDADSTIANLNLSNDSTAYLGEGTVEQISIFYAAALDRDPSAYVTRDHTVTYDEENGLWLVAAQEYRPELTGETITVYYDNWDEEWQEFFFGYAENEDAPADYSRPAESIHVEFQFAVDEEGNRLSFPMTPVDDGETWKLELDKAYTNCWGNFFHPILGDSTFLIIFPTEDEMIYDNLTWKPYEESLNPSVTPGDLDQDGMLTTADATLLMQYLVGKDVEIALDSADVNGDEAITIFDVVRLLQIISL